MALPTLFGVLRDWRPHLAATVKIRAWPGHRQAVPLGALLRRDVA